MNQFLLGNVVDSLFFRDRERAHAKTGVWLCVLHSEDTTRAHVLAWFGEGVGVHEGPAARRHVTEYLQHSEVQQGIRGGGWPTEGRKPKNAVRLEVEQSHAHWSP